MPGKVAPIDFTELAEVLTERNNHHQKTALILGSRTGALFRSQSLYNWLETSKADLAGMPPGARFSACLNILKEQKAEKGTSPLDIKARLMYIMKSINFSQAEDYLADLVKQGIFKVILGNNPDDLIYDAFINAGMKEQSDFVDCPLERLSVEEVMQDMLDRIAYHDQVQACKLVRVYKDIDSFVYELDKIHIEEQSSQQVKNLLAKMHTTEALVVGLDPQWDVRLMTALPPQIETIWFVNEDESVKELFLSHNMQVPQFRYLVGSNGSYPELMRALYFRIFPTLPAAHDFIRESVNQQRIMQRDLMELKSKYEDMHKELVHIRKLTSRLLQILEDKNNHQ